MIACHRCKREFKSNRSLGVHLMHMRKAVATGKQNRICPDRRDDEEARSLALLRTRLKGKLGLGAFRGKVTP